MTAPTPGPLHATGTTTRFAPSRVTLLVAVLALLGALPLVASWPVTAPLLLVPVAGAVWVLRARVVLAPYGVEVCNGVLAHRYAWADVEGFDVPRRGPVRLVHGGHHTTLTAVPHSDARRLVVAAKQAAPPPG